MRKIFLITTTFAFGIFVWSIFGSINVQEVIGKQCGPEAVVPCIMYNVTREIDILEKYRIYAVSATGLLFIISSIILLKFGKQNDRRM